MPAKFQMLTLSPSGLIANASDKTRALIRVIYKMAELQVKVQGRDGDTATSGTFSVDRGSPQGDGLSPLIWLLVLSSVLRKRDPALQKSWQENRKPGEYREGDKYICRGCGICAREYAAAPADPTDPDTTMESEEGSDESDAGSEEKRKKHWRRTRSCSSASQHAGRGTVPDTASGGCSSESRKRWHEMPCVSGTRRLTPPECHPSGARDARTCDGQNVTGTSHSSGKQSHA
jgi:hypothetical protein